MNRPHHRQAGIALITVLLILALATVAAVAMTGRQQLDIRRTGNILQIEQAYMALLGAEEFAKRGLIEDGKKNKTDSFGDYWNDSRLATAMQTFGEFTVTNFAVEDLQGRFNINNLVDTSLRVSPADYKDFIRLLDIYGLPTVLADVAVDWLDSGDARYHNGAENDDYSVLERPYRIPNRFVASASEMLRFMGVNLPPKQDQDKSQRKRREKIRDMLLGQSRLAGNQADALPPVLIALPENTPINVNTVASPEIFQMLAPGLEQDKAQALFELIQGVLLEGDPYFKTTSEFWEDSRIKPLKVPDADKVDISVSSNYFLFKAEAINGGLVVYSYTILRRISDKGSVSVQVVRRSFSKSGEI